MPLKVKIMIADDHPIFTNGLRLLLQEEMNYEVVEVVKTGKELLDNFTLYQPDLVLLDINMPELNGLDALKHLKQRMGKVKIIILSTYNEEHLVQKARDYGANGYLLKTCTREELLQTIDLVLKDQSAFPYRLPRQLNQFDAEDPFLKQFHLTKREYEILQLIKTGLTNQQIADQLFLSFHTVESHRKNIMHKLKLNNPVALMKFIMEHNL